MPDGSVRALFRWPVKSLRGERPGALELHAGGVAGDRALAVVAATDSGSPLSARQVPGLLRWSAAYGDAPEAGSLTITAPGGARYRSDDPALLATLGADLDRTVELSPPGNHQDRPRTLLVTTEASLAALEAELGAPVDIRRFRPNIHLELDARAYAEEGWTGARMLLGAGARLRLLDPCERCVVTTRDPDRPRERRPEVLRQLQLRHRALFGVHAVVERPGTLAEGDRVEIHFD